jgi:hypothetical protein
MAAIRVLAVRRGSAPQLAYYEQGAPNPNLVRLRRSLERHVRRHGQPHHFKLQVVVGGRPRGDVASTPAFYGPLGTALPPSAEGNGLRLYASRPLSGQHGRDSALAFPTLQAGLAQQVIITPSGRVDCHPMVVEPA